MDGRQMVEIPDDFREFPDVIYRLIARKFYFDRMRVNCTLVSD